MTQIVDDARYCHYKLHSENIFMVYAQRANCKMPANPQAFNLISKIKMEINSHK